MIVKAVFVTISGNSCLDREIERINSTSRGKLHDLPLFVCDNKNADGLAP